MTIGRPFRDELITLFMSKDEQIIFPPNPKALPTMGDDPII